MDSFTCGLIGKVTVMPHRTDKDWSKLHGDEADLSSQLPSMIDGLSIDDDLLMEQILENLNSSPIGRVLKNIASLPEVSRQKVLRVRGEIKQGKYDLNERLDLALEKVLDDLNV